jgi:hypothetical protein
MPKSGAIFAFANRPSEETIDVESACLDSLRLLGGPIADRLCGRRHHCAASGSGDTGRGCRYLDVLQWGPRVYAAGPAAPTAILVLLPAIGAAGSEDALTRDPALWAAQGFDIVMPHPEDIYRLVSDQQAALARLVASAHAPADAPIWLVGAGPTIDAALAAAPQRGRGPVSGVVVTSVTSRSGSCSASVLYSDPGTGATPKIEVRKSGDCEAGSPGVTGRQPSVLPAPPAARPGAPRIIEASAGPKDLPPAAQVRRLAQLIKTSPSS